MEKRTIYLKRTVYLIATVMSFIIMIGTTGIGISGAAALNNIGRHVDAGYLLRENFIPMNPNLSGWEYKNWTHGPGASTSIISDSNAFSEVYMTKKFLPQKSTVITTEFRLLLLSDTSGAEIRLRNSSKSAIVIQINGNKLEYLERNGTRTYLETMEYTSWVGIKVVADISTGRADVYADGRLLVNDKEFTTSTDTLDNISFGITSSGKGSYKIGTLEIYKGYALYEKLLSSKQTFEQPETGNLFKGYTVRTGANNWQNSDNNTSGAYLGNDGNSATYWEGRPEFNNALYVIETSGKVLKINRLTLEVPNPATGSIYFTYLNTSNEWKSLKSISVTPASYTNNKIVLDFPEAHYCLSVAVVFSSGFAQGFVPKISEFQGFYINSGAPVQTQNLSTPSDWTAESFTDPDSGKIEVYDTAGYTPTLDYSVFRITDNNTQKGLKLSKSFSLKGDSIIEFQMNLVSRNDITARISQNNGNEMKIYSRGSDIYYSATGMSGEKKIITGYKPNVWYRYKIIYSASGGSAVVETNGFQAAAGKVSAGFASGVFNKIEFATSEASRGITMLDNIYIKPDVAERTVPVPKPLDTGKYILNMQVCNLWREGSHLGWQAFDGTAYENTKPLLGWYDEGDPEVSDWQIKWAVEHGINSFMYCWYRPDAGGIPNKDNSYSEELWDGYMNSRYKKMLNFTIMFTNHAPTRIYSEADMYENLMPYWIETFFKNPNYLKTSDNKPILYIYENSELLSHVGDANGDGKPGTPADVKTMFAKMRRMCVDAGFGGLVIAAEYRGNQSTVIDSLSSSGYDYVFAYTWHPIEKNMNDDSVLAQVKTTSSNRIIMRTFIITEA
ncbi:MAG: glycoside hydrolase family 71/99 protein [Saccharofermentanales bacterium]